jgi:protein-L-isoaspartate(D-aspartate) O-methyltransferase
MIPVLTRYKGMLLALTLCAIAVLGAPRHAWSAQDFAALRLEMLAEIQHTFDYTRRETGVAGFSPAVRDAFTDVPRHEFVPDGLRDKAYENRPLPIGHGQTISQPYIVALMTELLELDHSDRVLEIGTGSGYQAAILAELVDTVHSIEIVKALGEQARSRLKRLGYENVGVRIGDGYYGWEEFAPYDAIIVTAAAGHVPPPLVAQLKPGGTLVIPVGAQFVVQNLLLVRKSMQGEVSTEQILPVRFVPLTGGH